MGQSTQCLQEGLALSVSSERLVVIQKGCSHRHISSPHSPRTPQVMLESSVYLSLAVYSGCCLLAALASCFLPIETKGRGLQESSHREWGQEMVGRGTHGTGVARSNSGSQE